MRIFFRTAAAAYFCLLLPACNFDSVAHQLEKLNDTISVSSWHLDQGLQGFNENANEALKFAKDPQTRGAINGIITDAQNAAAHSPIMAADFVRQRLHEEIAAAIAISNGKPAPARVPFVGSVNPAIVRYSSTKQEVLTLFGWNLDERIVHNGFSIKLIGKDKTARDLPASAIAIPDPYTMKVVLIPDTDHAVHLDDERIVGYWKDKELFSLIIMPPLVDQTAEVNVMPVNGLLDLTHMDFSGTGDHDLKCRVEKPKCQQHGIVTIRHDYQRLFAKLDASCIESLPDYTKFIGSTPWVEIYELRPNETEVQVARDQLNLSDDYVMAVPVISAVRGDAEKKREIAPHADDVVEHADANEITTGDGNGTWDSYPGTLVAEQFRFNCDHDGNDDAAAAQAQIGRLWLTIRFVVPDGLRSPSSSAAPTAVTLESGVPLI